MKVIRFLPLLIYTSFTLIHSGVKDETGEQFVAYFLPTEETLEKRKADFVAEREYQDEEEYEYKMAREYNWNVKSKTSGKGYEENYFLVMRQDGIYYNELETRWVPLIMTVTLSVRHNISVKSFELLSLFSSVFNLLVFV